MCKVTKKKLVQQEYRHVFWGFRYNLKVKMTEYLPFLQFSNLILFKCFPMLERQ